MQPGNQYGCASEERERHCGVRHWCVPPSLPLHGGYSVITSGAVSAPHRNAGVARLAVRRVRASFRTAQDKRNLDAEREASSNVMLPVRAQDRAVLGEKSPLWPLCLTPCPTCPCSRSLCWRGGWQPLAHLPVSLVLSAPGWL